MASRVHQLLTTALLLISFLAICCSPQVHHCHNHNIGKAAKTNRVTFARPGTNQQKNLDEIGIYAKNLPTSPATGNWQPMRVTFDRTRLDGKVDTTMKQQIVDILESIQTFLQRTLLVQHLPTALRMPRQCVDVYTSSSDQTTGVSNTDLHIYVTAEEANASWIAWAGPCGLVSASGYVPRTAAGQVNLNTKYIRGMLDTEKAFQQTMIVLLHEFWHILGMDNDLFKYFRDFGGNPYDMKRILVQDNAAGGTFLCTPLVRRWAREHYGCDSFIGVQLENQGGSGSALSHWERAWTGNEFMTASATEDPILSELSLALLLDSGWYRLRESQKLPVLNWGKGAGCSFSNLCRASENDEFCRDQGSTACTIDAYGVGVCWSEGFSSQCNYNEADVSDDCRNSTGGIKADLSKTSLLGDGSRCFKSNVKQTTEATPSISEFGCFKYSCTSARQLTVTGNGFTQTCSSAESGTQKLVTAAGVAGSLTCPDVKKFCADYRSQCLNQCNGKGFCINGYCSCKAGLAGESCELTVTNPQAVAFNGNFVTACPTGTFEYLPSRTCYTCDASCLTCNGREPNNCLTCPTGEFLSDGYCVKTCDPADNLRDSTGTKCYSQCPQGFYPVNNVCTACPENCLQCTGTTCTKCQWPLYLSKTGTCVSYCPEGQGVDLKCHSVIAAADLMLLLLMMTSYF